MRFPVELRKMWTGDEVQAWIDHQLEENPNNCVNQIRVLKELGENWILEDYINSIAERYFKTIEQTDYSLEHFKVSDYVVEFFGFDGCRGHYEYVKREVPIGFFLDPDESFSVLEETIRKQKEKQAVKDKQDKRDRKIARREELKRQLERLDSEIKRSAEILPPADPELDSHLDKLFSEKQKSFKEEDIKPNED